MHLYLLEQTGIFSFRLPPAGGKYYRLWRILVLECHFSILKQFNLLRARDSVLKTK